jgi:hypothetical protein
MPKKAYFNGNAGPRQFWYDEKGEETRMIGIMELFLIALVVIVILGFSRVARRRK